MNATEYLKYLHQHDPVFNTEIDDKYTKKQMVDFAERYHKAKLSYLSSIDSNSYSTADTVQMINALSTAIAIVVNTDDNLRESLIETNNSTKKILIEKLNKLVNSIDI